MFLTLCLVLAVLPGTSLGYFSYQAELPNGHNVPHPCKANYMWPGIGHKSAEGGGVRNVFGVDFQNAGHKWTEELCRKDSDGDGKTNGEELGDPDCLWNSNSPPVRVDDITHPGICDPYDSEECKGKNDFVSCELEGFENCDAVNDTGVFTFDLRLKEVTIPPTETNYYCMTYDLPSDQDYHIIADEPILDNREVLHHILIYGCGDLNRKEINTPELCGMDGGGCYSVIAMWGVGFPGTCNGRHMGFRVGKTSFKRVRIEAHYHNPKLVANYRDASGIRLYLQPAKPEVIDLTTLVTGQRELEIPPGQRGVEISGMCSKYCSQRFITKPGYVLRGVNHMHYLGSSMKVELIRNGAVIKEITNDVHYSYDSPKYLVHDPAIQILPGDEFKTTCVFDSTSRKTWTHYGDGTYDEMCYAFLTIYPRDAISDMTWCTATGPLDPCQYLAGVKVGDCDWQTFTNFSHPSIKPTLDLMEKNCNLNGQCRQECRDTLATFKDHPCMVGEGGHFVRNRLSYSNEGIRVLARLLSCPEEQNPNPTTCVGLPGTGDGEDDPIDAGNGQRVSAFAVILSSLLSFLLIRQL